MWASRVAAENHKRSQPGCDVVQEGGAECARQGLEMEKHVVVVVGRAEQSVCRQMNEGGRVSDVRKQTT